MNVKETLSVLKFADKITIIHGDHAIEFSKSDELAVNAFAKYIVESVSEIDGERKHYMIDLAMRPVVDERM